MGCKRRGQKVYENLSVPCQVGGSCTTSYTDTVWYQVGARKVCADIFRLCYPVSDSTLKRLVAMRKIGIGPLDPDRDMRAPSAERGAKSMYVTAWWRRYAENTAERLPDYSGLMTPRRHLVRHYTYLIFLTFVTGPSSELTLGSSNDIYCLRRWVLGYFMDTLDTKLTYAPFVPCNRLISGESLWLTWKRLVLTPPPSHQRVYSSGFSIHQ
jgi:hypothetical protein